MQEAMQYSNTFVSNFIGVNIAYGSNLIFPRLGEVLRATTTTAMSGIPTPVLFGTIITERIIDVLVTFLCLAIVIIGNAGIIQHFVMQEILGSKLAFIQNIPVLVWILLFSFFGAVTWFSIKKRYFSLLWNKIVASKIGATVAGFQKGVVSVKDIKNQPLFIVYSLGIWAGYVLCTYFSAFSYVPTNGLSMLDALFITVLGAFGMSAPVPGGIGAYHKLIQKGLILLGIVGLEGEEPGLVFATVVHGTQFVFTLVMGSIAGIAYWFYPKKTENLTT